MVLPAFCRLCLVNEDLSPAERVRHWVSNTDALDHIIGVAKTRRATEIRWNLLGSPGKFSHLQVSQWTIHERHHGDG